MEAADTIDKMISLKEKQIVTLKLLKKALVEKEYQLIVKKINNRDYLLYDTVARVRVLYSTIERINSYLNVRNLQGKVYYEEGISMKIKTLT